MGKLDGHVAFITGAARGQGRSHAVMLAAEGADIVALDVCRSMATAPYPGPGPEDLAETARQVRQLGRRALAVEADVRDLAALDAAAERAVAELGGIDIVIANAGISNPVPTLQMDEQTWDEMIEINLSGQWKTLRATLPHVVAGGRGGSVVITSSLAALKPDANIAHYAAAKAGLVGMMRVLAREMAPHGIRVNTVHPTTVATEMILNDATYRLFRPDVEQPTRADFEKVARRLNKLGVPAIESVDVTNAVLYLVTDAGRYVTGTALVIDAGGLL